MAYSLESVCMYVCVWVLWVCVAMYVWKRMTTRKREGNINKRATTATYTFFSLSLFSSVLYGSLFFLILFFFGKEIERRNCRIKKTREEEIVMQNLTTIDMQRGSCSLDVNPARNPSKARGDDNKKWRFFTPL